MDRTKELFSIIEVLKQTGTVTPSPYAQLYALRNPSSSSSTTGSVNSTLLLKSRQIGKTIRTAQRSVLRLVHLVQRKGLFDDPAIEINELTIRIKTDLQSLDQSLQLLTNQITSLFSHPTTTLSSLTSTSPTTPWDSSSDNQFQQILHTILDTLRGHVLVITRMFQEALRIRSDNMKDQATRRKQYASSRWTPNISLSSSTFQSPLFSTNMNNMYSGSSPGTLTTSTDTSLSTILPPVPSVSSSSSTLLPDNTLPTQSHSNTSSSSTAPSSVNSSSATGLRKRGYGTTLSSHSYPSHAIPTTISNLSTNIHNNKTNQYSMQLATLHDARVRENDMKSIESTIVELGSMFTHMATVVAEQGDTINRIDTDMDIISSNVEKGKNELTQFYSRVTNQRQFILKLFGLLIFIILLFAIFRPPGSSSSFSSLPEKSDTVSSG